MKFNYQARTKDGQTQTGVVEASSREAALDILAQSGIFVTVLEAASRPLYARRLKFFDRTSPKDLVLFSRELAILFKARVSLVEALRTIARQTKREVFAEKITKVSEAVEAGTPFSDALAEYPDTFNAFYTDMVKSGEASGQLSDVLEYLAAHLEREYELTSRIKGALIYPSFVIFIAVAVVSLLMFFVIPNLKDVLLSTGQELPAVTLFILGAASFVRAWGLVLLLALAGAAYGFWWWIHTPSGGAAFSKFLLRVPLLGTFVRLVYLSRFAENLSTLVTGGLPIVKSLEITASIVGNELYEGIITEAKEGVQRGERIGTVLQRYPREFPPIFTQMVMVGEQSGSLDTTLLNVVEFYRQEVSRMVDTFLAVLEPALIVILGAVVGGIMAAILLPLYQLASF